MVQSHLCADNYLRAVDTLNTSPVAIGHHWYGAASCQSAAGTHALNWI